MVVEAKVMANEGAKPSEDDLSCSPSHLANANKFALAKASANEGGLAQLARASALHAEGQRFESVILHLSVLDLQMSNVQR